MSLQKVTNNAKIISPRLIFYVLVISFLINSCVNPLDIGEQNAREGTLVIQGSISDQPGPYTVRLYRTTSADNVLEAVQPVSAKAVSIHDDTGQSESLNLSADGFYTTSAGGIQGVVGRKYQVRVELQNGNIFESEPEELYPGGVIDSLYYQWESLSLADGGFINGFRVFIDARSLNPDQFVRWKFSGTYMAESFPHLNKYEPNCSKPEPPPHTPDPLPCSGYITTGVRTRFGLSLGDLIQVGDCTCCVCYVNDAEDKPHLNNDVIGSDGTYKKIEVGFVRFDEWTFGHGKYMLKVEQMSLSQDAFQFWKIIKDQKEGANSLFQPAFGRSTTNLRSVNSEKEVLGYFFATSINKKVRFLTPDDSPIPVPDYAINPEDNCALWRSCTDIFPYSSLTPPPDWE